MSRVPSGVRFGRVLMLGVALILGLTTDAVAAVKVAKPLPAGAVDGGVLPSSTAVQATVYLQPDAVRVAALTQFLSDVQTPGSKSYRQFATAAQFATTYGASTAQVERVQSFVQKKGLSVTSVSGLRMVVTGSATQVEAAFAPGLHQVTMGSKVLVAATNVVTVPSAVFGDVASIGGMETVPETTTALKVAADGVAVTPGTTGSLDDLSTVVETDTARVVTVDGTACVGDFADSSRSAMENVLREAAAQGLTVLVGSGCATSGDVSFPAVLPEVVSVALVAGVSGELGYVTGEARPTWQSAVGLPADALRHEPDVAVSSLSAMASTFTGILVQMDADALKAGTTTTSRLGDVGETLYEMASLKGLYTQPDATATGLVGNWETADGLGAVNLKDLADWYPRGSLSTYVTVTTTPAYVIHGATASFYAQVKDVSGQGTAIPTGTVTFATDTGISLGSGALVSDGTGGAVTVTSNQTPAGTYNVVATYSGDTQYAGNSNTTYFQVGPEEGNLGGTVAAAVNLGGTIMVTVIDKSASGVGTPNVTATVQPQGIADTTKYSVQLTGSNGTATGLVNIPASVGGSITLLVSCVSADANFTCYNSTDVTATVNKATPTATMTQTPTVVTANTTETLTFTIAGVAGQVVPTGTVIFYDNGVNVGQNGVSSSASTASVQLSGLSPSVAHNFTATYYGDNNYVGVSASPNTTNGVVASTTTMTVSPNPPVSGSTTTLSATVASGSAGSTAVPTGTVTFYQDGVALTPTATLGATGVATITSTTLNGSAAHTFYAVYGGSTTYSASTSPSVATAATGTVASSTTMTVSPNPPVSGSTTTLSATVASGSASSTAVPTGTVTFYQDGVALTPTGTLGATGVATMTSTTLSSTTAHTYYAAYGGNSTYVASTSPSVPTAAATSGSTTTTLTVSPNVPVSGSLTTLSATIGYTANGSSVPTGTVTFYQDGTALTPAATVVGGTTATFTSTTLSSTAAHSYTAKYSGDTSYTTSTSAAVATTAASGVATTTALSVTPNPPVSGSTTTLKATLGYTASGSAVPTGTVTFYQDGTALTPAATVVSGTTATYTSTTLSGTAAHSFTATYSGDTTYATSTSTTVTTTANTTGVASAVTITASPTTVASGGTTTLLATVTSGSASSTTVPTGTVSFTSSLQGSLGTAAVNSSGVATLSPTLSTAGTGTITAVYSGDTTYATSTSATPATVTVTGSTVASTITLTISPSPVTYGGTVTLSTTVTAVPTSGTTGPAGSVTWTLTANATGVVTTYTQALTTTSTTTATASATITAPAAGNYTVTATCTGTNFSCTGLTISKGLAVTKVTTLTTLVADPNPPVSGQPVLLTAYIASAAGAINATCGGTVNFTVNGVSAGTAAVSGNEAQLTVTLPLATGNVVYAVYSGDANCTASTSASTTLSVPPAATTTVVTVNNDTALYTADEVFTVVVTTTATATNPNPGYATGTVTFYDTFGGIQKLIGSASLSQNGPSSSLAQFQTTGLLAGTHTVLAIYAGSKAYATSTADAIVVNMTDYSTAFSPSSSTVAKGSTVTALATVTAVNGFTGQVVLGCVPPSGSATTCTFSPTVLTSGGGISTMTITTTAATTGAVRWPEAAGGASLALAMLGLLWPGRKRRKLSFVVAALLSVGLIGAMGCTTVRSDGQVTSGGGSGGGSGSSGGTPSGTLLFAITASGTDGKTVSAHTLQYSVTVQ